MADALGKFRFGEYTADLAQRTCSNGAPLDLSWRSFEALRLLLEARGAVVEKETFFRVLWPGVTVEDSSLAKCIGSVRKSLNGTGPVDYIETVPRVGYRLAVPVEANEAEDARPPVGPRRRIRWWPFAAVAAIAAASVAGGMVRERLGRISRAEAMYAEGLKMISLNRPEDTRAAVEAYRTAIQLNPAKAIYHASLAEALGRLPIGPTQDPNLILEAAERAVRIDPGCGNCQATLGFAYLSRFYDWEKAGPPIREAARILPEHPGIRGYLAMWLASQGKLEEALTEVDRGIGTQPYQATLHTIRAAILTCLRRHPDAIGAAERALSFHRPRDSAWDWRAYSQFALGKPADGVLSYTHRLFPDDAPRVETMMKTAGPETAVRWLIDKTENAPDRKGRSVNRAHWKLLLNDRDGAVSELEIAEGMRHFELIYLAGNPAFAPLGNHPRFRAILTRMKLEHALR